MTALPQVRRRGRPSRDQAAVLTERIVAAALRLFLEQGYEATTMDAVAGVCEVSKHTLYRRYPSKALLFRDAVDRQAAQILHKLETGTPDQTDPVSALRRRIALARDFSISPPAVELFRMCISAVGRFPEVGVQFTYVEQRIIDTLEPLVRQAQAEGRFHPGNARRATSRLYYALVGESWIHVLTGSVDPETVGSRDFFDDAWAAAMRGFEVQA